MYGEKPTRHDVVHWLANKDGGAHIDKLPPRYVHLLSGQAMGVAYSVNGIGLVSSPFPAVMRQIAEEVRLSLRREFAEELAF